jgi:hypothetical protein
VGEAGVDEGKEGKTDDVKKMEEGKKEKEKVREEVDVGEAEEEDEEDFEQGSEEVYKDEL